MYRTILFSLVLWSVSFVMQAQSASAMLIMMPEDLIPQLTVDNRKDMVDFANVNREDNVQNKLGGNSRITEMSEDFVEVALSEKSSMQLKIFPYKDTIIVGVINTVCAPACDSRINFYTTDWEDLGTPSLWKVPAVDDFIAPQMSKKSQAYRDAVSLLDMWLMRYLFEKDGNRIMVQHTVEDYLPEEILNQVKPVLSDKPLYYNWTGKKFKKAD